MTGRTRHLAGAGGLALLAALSTATVTTGSLAAERLKQRPPEADRGETAARRVEIVNGETARIVSIYISGSRERQWGDDLLGDDELDAHSSATFDVHGPCRVDVRIDFEGGASERRRFVDVCRFPSLVIEPGWTLKPMVSA